MTLVGHWLRDSVSPVCGTCIVVPVLGTIESKFWLFTPSYLEGLTLMTYEQAMCSPAHTNQTVVILTRLRMTTTLAHI